MASQQQQAGSTEERKAARAQELRALLQSDEGRAAAAQLVQGGEHASHECMLTDAFIKRWLRARGWDAGHAYSSILKHAAWRVAMMPSGKIEESSIANELACEKVYIQGLDKHGRPLMIVQVRKHNGWTRALPELERLCCYALDALVARAPLDRNPWGQLAVVLDLTDMGTLSMDVQAVKTLLTLLGNHYVERLGCLFFYNPPYIFWGVWNTLSPLVPEVTRKKLRVIDPAKPEELHADVSLEVLPTQLGGKAELGPPLGK